MILNLILIIFLIYFIYYLYKKCVLIYYAQAWDGPPALPIIGNGLLFYKKNSTEIIEVVCNLCIKYGKQIRFWMGTELNMICTDPKDLEVILTDPKLNEKSTEYFFMKEWLGEGLLISGGEKWFRRRKIITPAFHFKILEQFVEVFNRQCDVLLSKLNKFSTGETFNIMPFITLFALDVICESAIGKSTNAQNSADSEYVQAVNKIAKLIHSRQFNFFLRSEFIYKISPASYKIKKILKILHNFTDNAIIERRKILLENQTKENYELDGIYEGTKRKMGLLDILLHATIDGKPLTNIEIREELDTFTFEGHDTITSAIGFAIYNLAKYPNEQEKLFNEIYSVFDEDDLDKNLTMNKLNNLHYMEVFIKESLRLFPPVPILGRKVVENMTINGKFFPADTNIIMFTYYMGRDPDLFSNPTKFMPERFLGEFSKEKINPFMYVPFSAGPRNCIGQKFAMLEMKTVLTKIIKNYEIKLAKGFFEEDDPVIVLPLIIKPKNGILLNLKPRTK